MAILTYVSDQIRKDAEEHGIDPRRIEDLAEEVERTQRLEKFGRTHPYPCLVRKKFPLFNHRLIAVQKSVAGQTVAVCLRVLIKSNRNYTENFEG